MREHNHEFVDHWFHTPSSLEKTSGLWLIRAGQNIAKPNYHMGPRFITYYSFHFIRSGKLVFNENDILESGDMFCLWPNLTHQYGYPHAEKEKMHESVFSASPQPLRMFWIALGGRQAPILAKKLRVAPNKLILKNILNPHVESVIDDICALLAEMDTSNASSRYDAKILSLIYALFHELSIQAIERQLDEDDDWLSKAAEYIHLHYMDGITVHDVVRRTGLNRSHFSRSFATKYGLSPNQYLQDIRMSKAAEMLETSHYSITEIALSLGYPDLYSFTRAFRRYFSMPPSEYRKRGIITAY